MKRRVNQNGLSLVGALIIVVLAAGGGVAGYYYYSDYKALDKARKAETALRQTVHRVRGVKRLTAKGLAARGIKILRQHGAKVSPSDVTVKMEPLEKSNEHKLHKLARKKLSFELNYGKRPFSLVTLNASFSVTYGWATHKQTMQHVFYIKQAAPGSDDDDDDEESDEQD